MKALSFAVLAALSTAGNAIAADGLLVQNEDQFSRDYAGRTEIVAPGVYRITAGEFAGKTVAIGDAGLAHDLQLHRERATKSGKPGASAQIVRELERVQARQSGGKPAGEVQTRASNSGGISCAVRNYSGSTSYFSGFAFVNANAELYLSNGGGGFNYYYARAYADATGEVFKPSNVPSNIYLAAGAVAENRQTGQVLSQSANGGTFVDVASGTVFSGPTFSHDLVAFSYVSGRNGCSGYVSVSDSDWLN